MDVVALLRASIERLPTGDHTSGLTAVLKHIQVAVKHFEKDRDEEPDSCTDAIFRCNQAFEGSLKEAFRVLASQDPAKKTNFEIENYLTDNEVMRAKVLTQFTRYRQEYRNPSIHDHKIDFDENEALLGILSVTGLAKLLVDQIRTRLEFEGAEREILADNLPTIAPSAQVDVADQFRHIADSICEYLTKTSLAFKTDRENAPIVAAFLSNTFGRNVILDRSHRTSSDWYIDWDIILKLNDEEIGFAIFSSRGRQSPEIAQDRLNRLGVNLEESGLRFGMLIEGAARGERYDLTFHETTNGRTVARIGRGIELGTS